MQKVLIANRGEIAVRIIRACRDLGLATVAVYSDADRTARHVRMADEAVGIGPPPAVESYLRIDALVTAARRAGADAVHPGYGFLSENASFAAACRDAGLTFVGPTPETIAAMGSKTAARDLAVRAGVPVVPGTNAIGPQVALDEVRRIADQVGYPLLVKAVAGGGGKGMRAVHQPDGLESAVRAARSEAGASFGDASIYFERQLLNPRHVEVQLLADAHGTTLPFVERECSIQRRHQKLVEESPSPAVSLALRAQLAEAAVAVARASGYLNAGTIEFLLDGDGRFYFLEMNTRLQVEHPVTEAVTGVDLVAWQFRIARGERLTLDPERLLVPRGHAIECRIYAEDPDNHFLPSPGRVSALRTPGGPGVRDDGGLEAGEEVTIYYDPLVSKLTVWGDDRPHAIARLRRALREYEVRGIRTTVPFFNWLLQDRRFVDGDFGAGLVDSLLQQMDRQPFAHVDLSPDEVAAVAAALALRSGRVQPAGDRQPADAWRRNTGDRHPGGPPASSWRARARLDALRH